MKKIGVLGTGMVGISIANKLIKSGYEVKIGSRTADNKVVAEWVSKNGSKASAGTFDSAAAFGELVFLCVHGEAAVSAVTSIKSESIKGKTIIDITNPLDFAKGFPPTILPEYVNTNSLGEAIQKALPGANIVKTLNIVSSEIMVDPLRYKDKPTMFLSGNSSEAKEQATEILKQFGWSDILDLGDISNARAQEMLVILWTRILNSTKNAYFAFKIIK